MKKAKIKEKQKTNKKDIPKIESSFNGKTVVITFLTIIVTFTAFYFLTDYLVSGRKSSSTSSNTNQNKNTNVIAFTNLLKQTEKEYYVLAILKKDEEEFYEKYAAATGKKYYKIDMSNTMNKSYIGDETSIGEKVKDIKISDSALFVIKEGKIESHHVGREEITKYLQKNFKVDSSNSNK